MIDAATMTQGADGALGLIDRARSDRANLFNKEKLLKEMADREIDAVIATSAENVTYTSGAYMDQLLISTFVVTTRGGSQAFVVNDADAFFARDSSWIDDVRDFGLGPSSRDDALRLLVEALDDLDVRGARIGIEYNSLPLRHGLQLQKELGDATLLDAEDVFRQTRAIKTAGEIELFAAAALATAQAMFAGFTLARVGDTEKTLQASIQSAALHRGADSLGHAHVHSGVHSTVVHTHSVEQPIRRGEVIHVDFGAGFAGYKTDLARNAVVLEPSPRQSEIYRRLWEVQDVLIDAVKPGVGAAEVFELSQKAHADAGLEYPWATIGHSTGLSVHEGFELARGVPTELESGMILNIEPTHIEAGDARYHAEDTVLVIDGGARVLSDFGRQRDLFVIN